MRRSVSKPSSPFLMKTAHPDADNTGIDPRILLNSAHETESDSLNPLVRKSIGMSLIKSKRRVNDHGEVFTPPWMVDSMLDLVKAEAERIESRFLEPACGTGHFTVTVLGRKLEAVERRYGKNAFERRHFALLALMSCYGIELLADNARECRANMLDLFQDYTRPEDPAETIAAARHVLKVNIIQGDAVSMKAFAGAAIIFAEWGYLGKGRFQRRDFRLDVLTGTSSFKREDSLFAKLGRHEIFTPLRSYEPMTIDALAATPEDAEEAA